jgi:hypothetical protein
MLRHLHAFSKEPDMRISSSESSVAAAGRDLTGPIPEVADPLELRDIAESILSPRQYEIWHYHVQGYNAMRIAQIVRTSLRTVERELTIIRRACKEAEIDRKEGKPRLGVTIAFGADEVSWRPDETAIAADRRLSRKLTRRAVPAA